MKLNINACYVAAEVGDTDFNQESFEEVKKILLLELKASGGDYIMIDGEPYSKQDLLDYFESVREEFFAVSGKEVPEIPLSRDQSKTWHSPLSDPISIMHVFEEPNELMDSKKLEEAKALVEKLYGTRIIQVCQQQFKDRNFNQLQFLLSYKFVFSSNLAHEIKRSLSILFQNLCLRISKEIEDDPIMVDVENSLFLQSAFYSVLFYLKDANEDLTRTVMRIGVNRFVGANVTSTHMKQLFEKFMLLPHDGDTIAYVRKNIKHFENKIAEENGEVVEKEEVVEKSKKPNTEALDDFKERMAERRKHLKPIIRKIVSPIVILGMVALIILLINNSFKKSKTEANEELIKSMEESLITNNNTFYELKDVISAYPDLVKKIEGNVTNPKIALFLKNSLHQFCYKINLKDTVSFTFDTISAIPGCVPMEFMNDSKLTDVLFVVYDEVNPKAKIRAKFINRFTEATGYNSIDLYILPTERAFVILNPNMINDTTVGPTQIKTISAFNLSYESYRLKNNHPKKTVYLSLSEYKDGDYMLTHIYETMILKMLNN